MSTPTPSIKGSIFALAVQDLLKLVAEGQVSRAELEAKLEPADAAYLDETIQVSRWYDVHAYGRFLELLKEIVGDGRNGYLLERGSRSARALLERGLYQQMEYLSRTQVATVSDPEQRFRAFGRDLRLLTTLSLTNFGDRTIRVDPDHPDRYVIEFSDAEAYPEALCWTTQGFFNGMASRHDTPDLWYWERPRPDQILFRMNRAV